jgi:hypothetical protein
VEIQYPFITDEIRHYLSFMHCGFQNNYNVTCTWNLIVNTIHPPSPMQEKYNKKHLLSSNCVRTCMKYSIYVISWLQEYWGGERGGQEGEVIFSCFKQGKFLSKTWQVRILTS